MGSYYALLDTVKSYGSLSEDEQRLIINNFRVIYPNKKEILIRSGEDCDTLFFVNKGLLRAYYINEKGNEVSRMITREGKFLTNIRSFGKLEKNHETIQALEDSEVLCIKREDFYNMMGVSKQLNFLYSKILEEYTAMLILRFEMLNTGSIEKKLLHLQEDFPFLVDRVSDTLLASFLGISRETFVRNKQVLYSSI